MLISPCYNCEKRFDGCHATCDDYKFYLLQYEEALQRLIADRPPAHSPANKARRDRIFEKFLRWWNEEQRMKKKPFDFTLLIISLVVVALLATKQDAWPWIFAYWVVLAVKNWFYLCL